MYACLYSAGSAGSALIVVAQQFSPRYETRGDLIVIDVRGLDRLFGTPRAIGDELRRDAADRGLRAHVAIASTQTAAVILAISRPGVVVIERGEEAAAIAPVSLDILEKIDVSAITAISVFKRWGLRTLGDLATLPADELSSRLGKPALVWHTLARGHDVRPLVPDVEEERFEASLELEWPIEGLEPLSFVLTRLLEPLSLRLEQRDRGVAVLHVQLRLVSKDTHTRRLELPTPMRDVRTLRTLLLLDLESQSLFTPGAPVLRTTGEQVGIDRVTITIDPTPRRVLQHTLFTRPHPTPEQLSTLLARLGAAMGQDRVGAPVTVDSYRPGAFAMKPFATDHDDQRRTRGTRRADPLKNSACSAISAFTVVRRCRHPVPARVVTVDDRPVRVTSDRRSFAGGAVLRASGPWKTSGEWWTAGWDRDEWDVALSDGASYRVFLDHASGGWFIDGILD
jgi:protein ImuB